MDERDARIAELKAEVESLRRQIDLMVLKGFDDIADDDPEWVFVGDTTTALDNFPEGTKYRVTGGDVMVLMGRDEAAKYKAGKN